jgi:hypothetical protein
MTTTLTIRLPAAKKAAVKRQARPSVNAWLNTLIDRALTKPTVDWDEHFRWLHKHGRVIVGHPDDDLRRASR